MEATFALESCSRASDAVMGNHHAGKIREVLRVGAPAGSEHGRWRINDRRRGQRQNGLRGRQRPG